jgi:hypothetical protein
MPPLFFLLLVPVVFAHDDDWFACDAIDDDSQRLVCYDTVAGAHGSERDPLAPTAVEFGQSEASRDEVVAVESTIEKVSYTPRGQSVMLLANGQVWIENEAGRRNIHGGQAVTITKGFMSYSMKLESGLIVSVKRRE